MSNRKELSLNIREFALSCGADLAGIAPATFDEEGLDRLRSFMALGRQGDMAWLEDYEKRVDPEKLLPGAKSVIVIAVNYYREVDNIPEGRGRVARYAYGRDYHKVIRSLLKKVEAYIQSEVPGAKTKICVDSAPLLEKAYAVKAGLGFIGKNTTLITPEFGSFVLLGELLTNLELEYDEPGAGTCGTCTRCLDECPTKAIVAPHELDANRCISYLTIEHRGQIAPEFHQPMGNWIFGCDICQEVCPYNKTFEKPLQLKEFRDVKIAGTSISLEEILSMESDEEFLTRFAGSPLMRAKRSGLQRNARIAQKNGFNKKGTTRVS
ncbi:MAG TPA: tRNA epoxyqueuosine(34) reductase QueG [Candidatus Gracilibacteria bacterium]|nr:tRNA epoxyqueuosine(34) reductase QueG [Candidatus Gracilibacteria bacterium]